MTPMQAIVATTQSAAECARLDGITGTLQIGKRADLLALDGDPLSDIRVLQQPENLRVIMKDGQAFKNTTNAPNRQSGSALSTARAASVPIG
jgi:imidazolonepropionase-like amidohydrolase